MSKARHAMVGPAMLFAAVTLAAVRPPGGLLSVPLLVSWQELIGVASILPS
jgi:hypothetical protein